MDDTASRRSERSRSSKFCQNSGSIVSVTKIKIIKLVQKGSLSADSTLVRSEELSPFDKSTGMISPPLTPPRRLSPEPEHAHEPYPPNMHAIISMLPKTIQEISQIEQLSPQTIQLLGRLACYLKAHTRTAPHNYPEHQPLLSHPSELRSHQRRLQSSHPCDSASQQLGIPLSIAQQ